MLNDDDNMNQILGSRGYMQIFMRT